MPIKFLTNFEIKNVQEWKYHVEDESITTNLLTPFWNYLLHLVATTLGQKN